MNRKWISSILLPLVGVVAILAFAYGSDRLSDALNARISVYFDITDIMVTIPLIKLLSNLISMGGVLSIFWMVMTRTSRSRLTGVVFFLVGLFLVAFYFLEHNLGRMLISIYIPFDANLTPDTLFTHTAGGIAVIGLFILFLPKSLLIDK